MNRRRDRGGLLLRLRRGVRAPGRRWWIVALAGLAALALVFARTARASEPADAAGVAWRSAVEVAAGDAFVGPWLMNRSQFHFVDDPTVAMAPDGSVAVAWVDNRRQNVYLQRFDAEPRPLLDEPVDVSRSPGIFSWLPKIAMSDSGEEIAVLWQEIVFSGGSHGGEAFFSRSTDGGRTFSEPLNLSQTPAGDGKGRLSERRWHNGSLAVARGAGGALFTAWSEYEGALWLRRSPDGGASFEPRVRVAGSDERPARGPDLAVGRDGTVYLAWTVGEDPAADIHLAISTDSGRSFSGPRVPVRTGGHSDAPKIAVDDAGDLHLVYAESPSGMFGQYHVRHARLGPDGSLSGTPRDISAMDNGQVRSAHFPGLAVRGDAVYVIWERFLAGERRPRGVGLAVSRDRGQTFSPPALVPGTDDPALGANGGQQGLLMRKLAVNDAGDIAVVHSRFRHHDASRVRLIRGRAP
jgi:hypothetical protein